LKNSYSYYADHMNGDFEIQIREKIHWIDKDVNINNGFLLKVRIKSRHSKSVKYFFYVLIDNNFSNLSAIHATVE